MYRLVNETKNTGGKLCQLYTECYRKTLMNLENAREVTECKMAGESVIKLIKNAGNRWFLTEYGLLWYMMMGIPRRFCMQTNLIDVLTSH